MQHTNCIVILGPTASGKTHLACQLALHLNGEIISADSRQVYKRLNIGTGKDLDEYTVNGKTIPYHLIDIVEPGEQFYLHQFIAGLKKSFDQIRSAHKLPIICGGTGLYLDALRKDFSLTQVPEDPVFRKKMESLSKEELIAQLNSYPERFTQQVDRHSKKRLLRGIEIANYFSLGNPVPEKTERPYRPLYVGLEVSPEERKQRITRRLHQRLAGLIEETEALLKEGITHERLAFFGLEYKFASLFLLQKITKEELMVQLETAIFQFAKRQMTWFRKMEKEGVTIHWVKPDQDVRQLVKQLLTAEESSS